METLYKTRSTRRKAFCLVSVVLRDVQGILIYAAILEYQ